MTWAQKLFCKFAVLVLPAKSGALLQSVWFPGTDLGMGATLGFLVGLVFVVLWNEAEESHETKR